MRKYFKQSAIIILCAMLVFVLAHYSFTVSGHAFHSCRAFGCSACEEIKQIKDVFNFSKSTQRENSPVLFALILFIGFIIRPFYPKHHTLISQKVRLDD